MAIGDLAPALDLTPNDRLACLLAWLDRDDVDTVPLIDYDFTSVVRPRAPEDDLFSLLGHAGSFPASERLLAELVPDGLAAADGSPAPAGESHRLVANLVRPRSQPRPLPNPPWLFPVTANYHQVLTRLYGD